MEFKIPTLNTPQDLEQAIQRYRESDWNPGVLFALWEAIRNAAMTQAVPEPQGDRVPGEDSY